MMLVVNAGSSSIKLVVFDAMLRPVLSGSVTEIAGDARIRIGKTGQSCAAPDHKTALELAFAAMAEDQADLKNAREWAETGLADGLEEN